MLTDMKTLVDIAEEKGCAIPAFNVYNAETALGAIFAAEEANSCVILQMYSRLFSNTLMPAIAGGSLKVFEMIENGDGLRERLYANARRFRDGIPILRPFRFPVWESKKLR